MKVLILGDSPLLQTGFGRVNLIAAKRFQQEGWKVASIAGLTTEAPEDSQGIKIFTPSNKGDQLGVVDVPDVIKRYKPDILYMTADPGSVTYMAQNTPSMPILCYSPIEGGPIINQDWRTMLAGLPTVTTSQYGSDLAKKELGATIPYIYHGVNHETFKVIPGMREDVRKALKFQDKFVVICVATNVRRKQLPRLLQAIALLKHRYNQKDIVLYLHTLPFNNYWLEGWNLPEIVRSLDIESEVFFHPAMTKRGSYIPDTTGDANRPGVVELLHSADLFVLPSQVEGFGLPIAEAMACGIPVMVTRYAAGWEVAQPAGKGIPVGDWEYHKSGTLYANVDVPKMAEMILKLKRNPKERERMTAMGLERAKDFDWDIFRERLIPLMKDAIDAYQTSRSETEEENQGTGEVPPEEVDIREEQAEDSTTQSSDIPEGQGQVGDGQKP